MERNENVMEENNAAGGGTSGSTSETSDKMKLSTKLFIGFAIVVFLLIIFSIL